MSYIDKDGNQRSNSREMAESAFTEAKKNLITALKSGDPDKIEQANQAHKQAVENVNKERAASREQFKSKFPEGKDGAGNDIIDKTPEDASYDEYKTEMENQDRQQAERQQKNKEAVERIKKLGQDVAKGWNPSASAKRDIAATITGQPTGTRQDAAAATAAELSNQSNKQASQHGMEAQQHQQIANRNEFGEGDKKAVATQAADVKNKINAAGAAGAQAGLLRMQNLEPDYDKEQERQDTQRQQAEQQREKSADMRRTAVTEKGQEAQLKLASRDYNDDLGESARLSEGDGGTEEEEQPPEQNPQETQQEEQAQQEEETQSDDGDNGNDGPQMDGYDLDTVQTAYNKYVYGSNPNYDPYFSKGGQPRYSQERIAEIQPKVDELYAKMQGDPELAQKYADWLPKGRAQAKGLTGEYNAGVAENSGIMQQGGKTTTYNGGTKSDERVKNVRKPLSREFWEELAGYDRPPKFKLPKDIVERQNKALSDARCKLILESLENGGSLSDDDFSFLNKLQGDKFSFNGKDYDTGDIDSWDDDSVLDGYAEHIKNYLYTYKPEAQSLDPYDEQLDPEQEHIGPMAQDIEQVNPACVKETPEGVKTVDTARLAMMNAGAIGDLARELKELKAVLGGL